MIFKKRPKFDSSINCEGEMLPLPSMSGIGEATLKKKAAINPLPKILDEFLKKSEIGFWLISDCEFNNWNYHGDNIEEINNSVDKYIVSENELIQLVKPKYIEKMIGFIAPDQVVLVGFKKNLEDFDDVNIQKEWDSGNVVVFVECIDSSVCKVCCR